MKRNIKLLFLSGIILTLLVYLWRYFQVDVMPNYLRFITYVSLLFTLFTGYLWTLNKKKVIVANLLLVAFLVIGLETTLFFVLGMPDAELKVFNTEGFEDGDHIVVKVGNVLYPDQVTPCLKMNGSDTVFNVKYTIDHNHHRFTPGHDSSKTEYAIVFGCSIAFGEGLEDNQTIAYDIQKHTKNVNAYNFAESGTATNYMLAQLQELNLRKMVKEKNGKAFYIFFWDHMYRVLGTMDRHTSWMHLSPNFEYKNGKLVRNKLFATGRPIRSWFYENIYTTNIVKYFELDFPLSLQDHHIDFMADMMLESQKAYQKQFKNNEFYVVLYPNYIKYTPEQMLKLKAAMRKRKIKYVDLNYVLTYGGVHTFDGDPHPNKETNDTLTRVLVKKIYKN